MVDISKITKQDLMESIDLFKLIIKYKGLSEETIEECEGYDSAEKWFNELKANPDVEYVEVYKAEGFDERDPDAIVFSFNKDQVTESDTGFDHYGAKDMKHFKGPAYIEYDGGPRQIDVLVKAKNGKYVWKNKGGCPDSEWYIFPSYEDALKVQKEVGGEILSYNEYKGMSESLDEDNKEFIKLSNSPVSIAELEDALDFQGIECEIGDTGVYVDKKNLSRATDILLNLEKNLHESVKPLSLEEALNKLKKW